MLAEASVAELSPAPPDIHCLGTRSTPAPTRRAAAGAARPAPRPRWSLMTQAVALLLVTEASGAERVVTVDGSSITIGREPGCAVRIDSPYVSRRHARIEPRPAGPTLVDLGSHDGSALNGARVCEPVLLRVGDVITIADVTITCLGEPRRERVTPALPPPTDDPVDRPAADRLCLDAAARRVRLGAQGPSRRLSAQELALLRYLYARTDRACTRAELGDAIWGVDNWDATSLNHLVRRLRQKIEPDATRPCYLLSVPGVGYRLAP